MMKWLAIVNPFCGSRKKGTQFRHILAALKGLHPTSHITQYPGHATQLAQTAADFDGFVVVGGDGTLFEVVNGMDVARQHLAIIPAGTGNSLARDLGLTNPGQAIVAIHADNRIRVDLLRVTLLAADGARRQCYASCMLGLGYPANAADIGNRYLKAFGKWCYPLAAVFESCYKQDFTAQLSYNGNRCVWQVFTGLLFNNTRHVGNFEAFPEAALDDGYLDVMEMRVGGFKQNLHNLAVLSKTYWYAPAKRARTMSLSLELRQPQEVMIDGELFPQICQVNVQIVPRQLTCYQKGL